MTELNHLKNNLRKEKVGRYHILEDIKDLPEFSEEIIETIEEDYYHKETKEKEENVINIKLSMTGVVFITIFVFLIGLWVGNTATKLYQYKLQEQKQIEMNIQAKRHVDETNMKLATIDKLEKQVETKDTQIEEYKDKLQIAHSEKEKINIELQKFQQREELYDKYEIMVMNTNEQRTEITYDDIAWMEEYATSKKYQWV